ncbi:MULTISPECIES: helix-turn-helix domain-containing protein [Calothrix]|uniref:Helix-turn-helix domain-containing protein n=2 Tax=Calothrix TaxID=1186 RepID=A0ABR8AL48_9CYAN|nr:MULTISPECIES: helix-turn-helix domain-containing protein [Calothrix]MBD2199357.1 helix-turn-helix domain-containing protein [Calothrix parietina FACHB-288]MBD2229277.1 helix-turn-helix domain-containing protein [Calothrix anomala FACHB-343]
MARQLKIEILESAEFLEKSLKRAKNASQKERLQMLWWLKTGQVKQHHELGQLLGRSPATITRWLQQYRQGGLEKLLEVRTAPGAQKKIQGEALEKLKNRLASPESFRSYREIVEWLDLECGLQVKYDTVNRFVREKLKAKLKVSRLPNAQPKKDLIEKLQPIYAWQHSA